MGGMAGMSGKVNPHNLRVGVIKDWKSEWEPSNDKEELDKNKKHNSNNKKEIDEEER